MQDHLQELQNIRAKRNTALTIFEPKDMLKMISSIRKQVSCIKHDSKRGQLLWVVKHLEDKVKENTIVSGICCIAVRMDGSIYFKHLPATVWKSEYYYDDCFHLLRVQEVLLSIPRAMKKEIDDLDRDLLTSGESYQIDPTKIGVELSSDNIKIIYHIVLQNNHIPLEFLSAPVKIIDGSLLGSTAILKSCKVVARLKQRKNDSKGED